MSKGLKRPDISKRQRSLEEILVLGSQVKTDDLKRRLIRVGLKEAACEMCHGTQWNGRPIPLELDHVNGRSDDNRLENLRILCPNCHAQTPTYRARNIGKSSLPPYPNGRGRRPKPVSSVGSNPTGGTLTRGSESHSNRCGPGQNKMCRASLGVRRGTVGLWRPPRRDMRRAAMFMSHTR